MKIIKNYIYGQHLESKSGNFSEIFNPSTGEVIGKVNLSNKNDLDIALDACKKAMPGWQNTSPLKRSKLCLNLKIC